MGEAAMEAARCPPVTRKRLSNVIAWDRLCQIFKLPTSEEYMDEIDKWDFFYQAEGVSEEEALAAEQEQRDEAYKRYEDAALWVFEDAFERHHLRLVPITKIHGGREYVAGYRIRPKEGKTWKDAAGALCTTINGVGYFYFGSVSELCRSGPWTVYETVLHHLGWIPDVYEVYEGSKAKGVWERRMRR